MGGLHGYKWHHRLPRQNTESIFPRWDLILICLIHFPLLSLVGSSLGIVLAITYPGRRRLLVLLVVEACQAEKPCMPSPLASPSSCITFRMDPCKTQALWGTQRTVPADTIVIPLSHGPFLSLQPGNQGGISSWSPDNGSLQLTSRCSGLCVLDRNPSVCSVEDKEVSAGKTKHTSPHPCSG